MIVAKMTINIKIKCQSVALISGSITVNIFCSVDMCGVCVYMCICVVCV